MKKWITLQILRENSRRVVFKIHHQNEVLTEFIRTNRFGIRDVLFEGWRIRSDSCPELCKCTKRFFLRGSSGYRDQEQLTCSIEEWNEIKEAMSQLRKFLRDYRSIEDEFFGRTV